jgi:hypothetical protein
LASGGLRSRRACSAATSGPDEGLGPVDPGPADAPRDARRTCWCRCGPPRPVAALRAPRVL